MRELRERTGYTSQKAFADAFGVAQTTVASWEGGKREPGYETTIRLAHFFGVSVDYLLGLEEKKEPPAQSGELSERDMRLLKWFRSLPPEKQKAILVAQDGPTETAD